MAGKAQFSPMEAFPFPWSMVFGDWSVLSAAVSSVGHGCPSTSTLVEGKRAPVAPQKLGWEYWGGGSRDQSPQRQTNANFTSLKTLLKGAPCWQGAPEAPGSCLSHTPVLGSNTLVAGQPLYVSDLMLFVLPSFLQPDCPASCC